MRKRTRLIFLATSTMVLAGASLSEPVYASTCTDGCYSRYRYCTLDPIECYEYLEICLARCSA